jgi:hypothetical protein
MPDSPWIMAQSWHQLLFAHWSFPPEAIRPLLPPELTLDTYAGQAWVGVVPFHMSGIRLRGLPTVPFTSAFAELNVRTYVTAADKPGVWFFSLDAANRIGVETARTVFHLPYFNARMQVRLEGETVHYGSVRTDRRAAAGVFIARYRPTAPVYLSQPGTLDHWLTERYCLYTTDRQGHLYRGEIHHAPWQLQLAEAEIEENTVTAMHGIHLPDAAPLLHYAERVDMLGWYLQSVT